MDVISLSASQVFFLYRQVRMVCDQYGLTSRDYEKVRCLLVDDDGEIELSICKVERCEREVK